MAANDYFNASSTSNYYSSHNTNSSQAPYIAYNPSSSSASDPPFSQSTINHTFGAEHTQDTKYSSDNNYYGSSAPQLPKKDSPLDPPSDFIPLQPKLSTTSSNPQNQSSQYPPSPESQTEAQLLPTPRKKKKKDGWFHGKIPWVVYVCTLAQLTVFVVEIIRNSIVTGSPIMIHPSFNPMIGPSPYMLINMGARFVPCMRRDEDVQEANPPITTWHCPNSTSNDPNDPHNTCDLSTLCGFGGVDNEQPDQWFRFIVPIFLHAGIIHIAFNMLLQLTLGREMEKLIGSIRFGIVYFFSGIFGFVLGANYAGKAVASTGASGALFGILALNLLDLIYHWSERRSPIRELMWLLAEIIFSFLLGLLPGLDNFAHIGGFIMGIALGVCILHSPAPLRQRLGESAMPYRNVTSDADLSLMKPASRARRRAKMADYTSFTKSPLGFFKGRKPLWWGWWLLRAGALIGVLVGFIVLLNNFYKYHDTCSWCKYLSCINVSNWCELDNLRVEPRSGNSKRNLAMAGAAIILGGALV
jgi:membrane associated rhomboid family serine protease